MQKKVAFIIGGSGGIGSAIVKHLLDDNFFVCATYSHAHERVELLRQELKGKSVEFYQMDLLRDGSIDRAMEKILKIHLHVDLVVFCPTLSTIYRSLFDCEWSDFEAHMIVQLKGMVSIMRHLREQIRVKYKTKFIIILTEACTGKPPSHMSPYVTAKYALMGFAKTMVAEFSSYNCTVNTVSPGMVQTELLLSSPSKLVEMAAHNNPLKRIATPDDVARVVSFLVSDRSDYLNGTNILVNGGSTMI